VIPARASNSKAQRQAPPSAAPQPRARLVALRALASNRRVRKEAKSRKATWMENGWKMDEWWSSDLRICSFTSVGCQLPWCSPVLDWFAKKKTIEKLNMLQDLAESHLFLLPTQMIGGIIWWTKKWWPPESGVQEQCDFLVMFLTASKRKNSKGLQGSK
jgi:hypothetical protein